MTALKRPASPGSGSKRAVTSVGLLNLIDTHVLINARGPLLGHRHERRGINAQVLT